MAQRTDIGPARQPLEESQRIADLEVEVEHLRRALASRDVIGQAKGILMERYKRTADEAFALLVHVSQRDNVRVAELCVMLAETGEWGGADRGVDDAG